MYIYMSDVIYTGKMRESQHTGPGIQQQPARDPGLSFSLITPPSLTIPSNKEPLAPLLRRFLLFDSFFSVLFFWPIRHHNNEPFNWFYYHTYSQQREFMSVCFLYILCFSFLYISILCLSLWMRVFPNRYYVYVYTAVRLQVVRSTT
jgi:hypothetical protein